MHEKRIDHPESYRQSPFEVVDQHIMVSLGPLNPRRYCSYRCPFCYVESEYEPFSSLTIDQIIAWVRETATGQVRTVYISGDTDSFAPPRANDGVSLLEALSELDVDLLFTTRATLGPSELDRIAVLASELRHRGHWLFGCVSITQASVPSIEPAPIPTPEKRAHQIAAFHDRGVVAVLTLRPFLANVPLSDYSRILDMCDSSSDLVLGGHWYADGNGILESHVFASAPPLVHAETTVARMPFDSNTADWVVHQLPGYESYVQSQCDARGLPFFMRSEPALKYWRHIHGAP